MTSPCAHCGLPLSCKSMPGRRCDLSTVGDVGDHVGQCDFFSCCFLRSGPRNLVPCSGRMASSLILVFHGVGYDTVMLADTTTLCSNILRGVYCDLGYVQPLPYTYHLRFRHQMQTNSTEYLLVVRVTPLQVTCKRFLNNSGGLKLRDGAEAPTPGGMHG